MKMEFRKLGDLDVSVIGLGTLRSFDVTSEEDISNCQSIVDNCVENQINLIDCASRYGEAEKVVGVTTQGRRSSFFLTSKVRCEGEEEGKEQIENSFRFFGTDYIDLYQVHNMIDYKTHISTLLSLKESGKIGMVGVTAMVHEAYPDIIRLMKSGTVDTVQIPYNVFERECEKEIFPVAEEMNIGILVMEPLKKGRYVKELKSKPDLTPLLDFGITTWAQALLAWVISDKRVATTIPATSKPERIHENALAGCVGTLPQELRDYIRIETERCLQG